MPIIFWDPETEALYADSLLVNVNGRVVSKARRTFYVDDKQVDRTPRLLAILRDAGEIDSLDSMYAAFCKNELQKKWADLPARQRKMRAFVMKGTGELSAYSGGEDYAKTTVPDLDVPWAIGSGAEVAKSLLLSGDGWQETMTQVLDQDVYSGGSIIQSKWSESDNTFTIKEVEL